MAGSHRAAAPPRRSRIPATVAVVVLLVAVAITGAYALSRPDHHGSDTPAAPRVTPTTPTPTTPSPTPTPRTPTPRTPAPTHAANKLPRVTPSAPRQLVVRGLFDVGFDSVVAPRNGVFTAASTAEVARWGGRGVPGNPAKDTVYVIGKVSGRGAFAELPKLHRGVRVSMRTQTGVLTYTVQAVTEKPAKGLTRNPTFTQRYPGRLQLVGIRYDARGNRTGTIVLVTAQLTAVRAGA